VWIFSGDGKYQYGSIGGCCGNVRSSCPASGRGERGVAQEVEVEGGAHGRGQQPKEAAKN
jgi:hypothetical protein